MNFDKYIKNKVILGAKNNFIAYFTQITALYIEIKK